jgi:sodium transport system permease protein
MRAVWVVLKKEIIDNVRDRRALGMALLFPALSPLIVAFSIFMGVKHEVRDVGEPFEIAVVHKEAAPGLVAHLQAHGAKITDAPEDPASAIRTHTLEIALVVEERFEKALHEGTPARVTLIADDARVESRKLAHRVSAIIAGYSSVLGAVRLSARGVAPSIMQAVVIESRDVSTPESRAALLLLGLPLMLAIAAFVGGLYVAIDTTAGERERGSLEALALNPISRRSIGVAKLLAVFIFGAGSLAASGIGFALMPLVVPSDTADIPIEPLSVLWLIAALLPVVLLATALQVWVGTRAKGFKEAQSSLSYISLVPVVPGMILTSMGGIAPLKWIWVPLFGQQVLMGRWLRGESVGIAALWPTLTTLLLALVLSIIALRRYDDERMYLP